MSALAEAMAAVPATASFSRTIGCFAWSRTIRYADDSPVGGIVVDVVDSPDPATGEVTRYYVTLDPYRARPSLTWHRLAEADIDPTTTAPAPTATVGKLICRLCEEVAMSGPHKHRRSFVAAHVDLIACMSRLAGVL